MTLIPMNSMGCRFVITDEDHHTDDVSGHGPTLAAEATASDLALSADANICCFARMLFHTGHCRLRWLPAFYGAEAPAAHPR
jgi:hypothetical protein